MELRLDQISIALAGTVLVRPFSLAITGGEVRVPAGALADAKISADTRIDATRFAAPAAGSTPAPSSTSEGNVQ